MKRSRFTEEQIISILKEQETVKPNSANIEYPCYLRVKPDELSFKDTPIEDGILAQFSLILAAHLC